MSEVTGHTATLGVHVSIERLIARRTRLQNAVDPLAHPDVSPEKRAELQGELTTIETALASYKAALADI